MRTGILLGMTLALAAISGCGNKSSSGGGGAAMKPASSASTSMARMTPPASMPATAPASTVSDADMNTALGLMDKMAAIADSDKGNCDKTADDLSKLVDTNKAEFARMNVIKKSGAQGTPEQNKRLVGAMGKLAPVMQACASNAKMIEVNKKMKE